MAFKMKGFSGFGNSPMKQRKDYTKKDYDFLKEQREERVKSTDYLTKTPTGPRATRKLTDFEKMSYAEQEKYMNEKHHSIAPTMSDFIHSARHKNKNKKNKKR